MKIEDRIKKYSSLALSVAAVSSLNAQIEYTKINPDETITAGNSLQLDVNADGQTDFLLLVDSFVMSSYGYSMQEFIYGSIVPYGSNAVGGWMTWMGSYYGYYGYYGTYYSYYPYYTSYTTNYDTYVTGPPPNGQTSYYSYYYDSYYPYYGYYGSYSYPMYYASVLGSGEVIGSGKSFFYFSMELFSNYNTGNLVGAGDKYLPFYLYIDGNVHYGWIRIEVSADMKQLIVKDAAYHKTPGMSIQAGQKK